MPKRIKEFDRKHFEQITHKHSHTLSALIDLQKKGLISEHDYLFTLDDLKAVAAAAYKGGWNNRKRYTKPIKEWTDEIKHRDAKKIFAEAFVVKI